MKAGYESDARMKAITRLLLRLGLIAMAVSLINLIESCELWWQDIVILFVLWVLFLYNGVTAAEKWIIEQLEGEET